MTTDRRTWAAVAAVTAAAAALRLAGLRSELWFDEVLSLRSVGPLHTLGQVLWSQHTDNKHHLTWVWLWLVGTHRPEWLYHLPSYVAGVATVPAAFVAFRRDFGPRVGLLAATLVAVCYPLAAYSTEARGYAAAVFLAVVAYALAPRRDRPFPAGQAAAFAICVVAGFLSHLTFAYAYAGLLAWAAADLRRLPRAAVVAHVLVLLAVAGLYVGDVRHLTYNGGPPTTALAVLRYTAALTAGEFVPFVIVAPLVTAAAIVALVRIGRRVGLGPAAFFTVAVLLAPAALTAGRQTPYLAVRYYLVCMPFAAALVAVAVTDPQWPRLLRVVLPVVVVVPAYAAENRAWQLSLLGRGDARECLARMADGSTGPIRCGSDRPVMDDLVLGYYAEAMSPPRAVVAADPDWWVLDLGSPFSVGPPVIVRDGREYDLDSPYPADPLSGLTWDLYKRRR